MRDEVIATEGIPVDLGDGVIVQVEVAQTGREKVKAGGIPFEGSVAKTRVQLVVYFKRQLLLA